MKSVLKWFAPVGMDVTVPAGKVVLFGRDIKNDLCMWVETDDRVENSYRARVLATGEEVPDGFAHAASFIDGGFVWHLYVKGISF